MSIYHSYTLPLKTKDLIHFTIPIVELVSIRLVYFKYLKKFLKKFSKKRNNLNFFCRVIYRGESVCSKSGRFFFRRSLYFGTIEYQNAVGTPTLVRKDKLPCASAMTLSKDKRAINRANGLHRVWHGVSSDDRE